MNHNSLLPLCILPDIAITEIKSNNSEFFTWVILHALVYRNDYKEDTLENVIRFYTPIKNVDYFLDLQLKFFLIRKSQNSINSGKNISEVIQLWLNGIKGKFSLNSIELSLKFLSHSETTITTYGKYLYDYSSIRNYIKSWSDCSLDLITWKKFKYFSIPKDFIFVAPIFKNEGGIEFPKAHIRKLFDEYVNEIYNAKFAPRLKNEILVEEERLILSRIMNNTCSDSDKKYINNLFINFYSWKILPENISKCLSNDVSVSELDINSNTHFANYFALIKYYKALTSNRVPKQREKFAIWFSSLPKDVDKKSNVFEELRDVFDMIKSNCPKANWEDFKAIFNKNGVTTKIEWPGDASILNFIFRKLNDVLSFNGRKWDVISHYFYKADKNDDSLSPEKLAGNSHYKNSQLEKQIKKVITTLELQ